MEVNNNSQKDKNNITQIKESNVNKKENIKNEINEKTNKDNSQKNAENIKIKINNKNNDKEIGNKRVNNFTVSNSNTQHNRYYSTNTSNHFFRNFVKKSNYTKNIDESIEQNDFYLNGHFNENRPFSFNSRNNFLKNSYINKGLDYFLGNVNPNNIYNKGFLDNKKNGYNYKDYVKGKRSNYVNKNIFFNNQLKKIPIINENESDIIYDKENEKENKNIISNNNINNNLDQNNSNELKQNYIRMNEVLKLDNLGASIMNIANDIINYLGYNNKILENELLQQNLYH